MQFKTFDKLSAGAVTLSAVLLLTGGLLLWGHHFASGSVRHQLGQQQIFFPPKGNPALAPADIGPYLNKYAGQQLLTGPQAKAFADHFIAVHLLSVAGGKTYAQVSLAALTHPTDATLQRQRQTLFEGQTIRGLLLQAYAFETIGTIARVSALASFALAGALLLAIAVRAVARRRDRETAGASVGQPDGKCQVATAGQHANGDPRPAPRLQLNPNATQEAGRAP